MKKPILTVFDDKEIYDPKSANPKRFQKIEDININKESIKMRL